MEAWLQGIFADTPVLTVPWSIDYFSVIAGVLTGALFACDRKLDIIGTNGQQLLPEETERILSERRKRWIQPASRHTNGILDIFTHNCASPMKGAYMENRKA